MDELEFIASKYIFKVRNKSRNILTAIEILERIDKSEFDVKLPGYVGPKGSSLWSSGTPENGEEDIQYWDINTWNTKHSFFAPHNQNYGKIRQMILDFNIMENRKDIDLLLI